MQKEITVKEFENTVNSIDNIEEAIILKRENKQDLIVISLEQYKKELFLTELSNILEKSEKEYEEGKVHNARTVFKGGVKNMNIRAVILNNFRRDYKKRRTLCFVTT